MILKILLSAIFVSVGILHFTQKATFLKAMPPFIPLPREMVFLTGVAAILLGILIWIKQDPAAWGMIIYLIAVFPVNIYMAYHPELFPNVPKWVWWARLPLQPVLIGAAYFVTKH